MGHACDPIEWKCAFLPPVIANTSRIRKDEVGEMQVCGTDKLALLACCLTVRNEEIDNQGASPNNYASPVPRESSICRRSVRDQYSHTTKAW